MTCRSTCKSTDIHCNNIITSHVVALTNWINNQTMQWKLIELYREHDDYSIVDKNFDQTISSMHYNIPRYIAALNHPESYSSRG